jgi:hypothetical protein
MAVTNSQSDFPLLMKMKNIKYALQKLRQYVDLV